MSIPSHSQDFFLMLKAFINGNIKTKQWNSVPIKVHLKWEVGLGIQGHRRITLLQRLSAHLVRCEPLWSFIVSPSQWALLPPKTKELDKSPYDRKPVIPLSERKCVCWNHILIPREDDVIAGMALNPRRLCWSVNCTGISHVKCKTIEPYLQYYIKNWNVSPSFIKNNATCKLSVAALTPFPQLPLWSLSCLFLCTLGIYSKRMWVETPTVCKGRLLLLFS